MALTNLDMLHIAVALHKKWTEITVREIQKAIDTFESLDAFDAYYTVALWMKRCDALFKIEQFIPNTHDIDERYRVILERFDPTSEKAREHLTQDAANRMQWFKQRIAKDFEQNVLAAIRSRQIQSPVEQFFLMEWEYMGLSKKYEVGLLPQAPVITDSGEYSVDFVITPLGTRKGRARVAIEIDGHDFHERTREQVRSDKKRERAIVRSGVTVLRFSGSEIVRNSRSCVAEVAKYLASLEEHPGQEPK